MRTEKQALRRRWRHELTEKERYLRRKVVEWVDEMFSVFCQRRREACCWTSGLNNLRGIGLECKRSNNQFKNVFLYGGGA